MCWTFPLVPESTHLGAVPQPLVLVPYQAIFEEDRSSLPVKLYKSNDHFQNFIDSIRSGKESITPCETAHRSASVGHLCNIALNTRRTINWNPKTETITNDPNYTVNHNVKTGYQQHIFEVINDYSMRIYSGTPA